MSILRLRGALRQSFGNIGRNFFMKWNLSEITRRADALYGSREQLENVRASVELLEAVSGDADFEVAWRLGRALFFLGQEEEQSREQARRLHARGARVCARAVRAERARVEGHFWLGVNLALQAQATRPQLLALGLALRAKRSLERAARINPAYHAAGPLRVLARLSHRLPRLLGGGTKRARAHFERAIRIAPANTVTRLYFAEMLQDAGDHRSAERELETILAAPTDTAWAFETERDRSLARRMLQRIRSSV
ncbi:MAG TPA: TRAP transporter TatT component family protein [Pyrinomonadaceae bacterium]|nr:TRAP transporter TatT component family protein [Pyrinomonadaceae bacterium]